MSCFFWAPISVLIIFTIWNIMTTNRNRKLFPPGPKGLPILGHLHLLGQKPHQALHHLAQKHGPIMFLRLGLVPTLVVSSPASAELVLRTHDLVFASRSRHQASKYISYGEKNILFSPYGPYLRNMRKLCTLNLLSNLKIQQFRAMRRAQLGDLVGLLRRAAERQEVVDISARVSGLTGDTTCLMVFGRKFADLEFDEKGFKALIEEALQVGALPNLGDFFPFMGAVDLQGLTRRMKDLGKIFDGFLERIIDDHRVKNSKEERNQDFLDTMMGIMEYGEAAFEFDRRHVKAVLLDLLIGGMDTSKSAVEWTLSELIRHPECMIKLQKELERVVGMDRCVEESHLDKLDYLDSVVKESFRIHPIIPLLIHESTEDCTLDGYHVPKGSRTIVNLWSIGRDSNVWPNPERFNPDRFVESKVDLRGNDFELLPFGSGRRGCPGMQLGLTVVRLVVAQLVHCFDWELCDGMSPDDLDMDEHFGIVMGRENHLMAIPTYRLLE